MPQIQDAVQTVAGNDVIIKAYASDGTTAFAIRVKSRNSAAFQLIVQVLPTAARQKIANNERLTEYAADIPLNTLPSGPLEFEVAIAEQGAAGSPPHLTTSFVPVGASSPSRRANQNVYAAGVPWARVLRGLLIIALVLALGSFLLTYFFSKNTDDGGESRTRRSLNGITSLITSIKDSLTNFPTLGDMKKYVDDAVTRVKPTNSVPAIVPPPAPAPVVPTKTPPPATTNYVTVPGGHNTYNLGAGAMFVGGNLTIRGNKGDVSLNGQNPLGGKTAGTNYVNITNYHTMTTVTNYMVPAPATSAAPVTNPPVGFVSNRSTNILAAICGSCTSFNTMQKVQGFEKVIFSWPGQDWDIIPTVLGVLPGEYVFLYRVQKATGTEWIDSKNWSGEKILEMGLDSRRANEISILFKCQHQP